jgi:hypothetical protein
MTQTYVITYGIPMGTSQCITGTGFVHARSYQHAWAAAEGSCGKGEQVLYVDLPPDPYPQDLDLLDYESSDVI